MLPLVPRLIAFLLCCCFARAVDLSRMRAWRYDGTVRAGRDGDGGLVLGPEAALRGMDCEEFRVVKNFSHEENAILEELAPETVHIPMKSKWFHKILSGTKCHEYRKVGKHWADRLAQNSCAQKPPPKYALLHLGGSSKDKPTLLVRVLKISTLHVFDLGFPEGEAGEFESDGDEMFDIEIERMISYPSGIEVARDPQSPPTDAKLTPRKGSATQKRKAMEESRATEEENARKMMEIEEAAQATPPPKRRASGNATSKSVAKKQRTKERLETKTPRKAEERAEEEAAGGEELSAGSGAPKLPGAKEKVKGPPPVSDGEWVEMKKRLIEMLPEEARPDGPAEKAGKYSYSKKKDGSVIQVILRQRCFWCSHAVGGLAIKGGSKRSFPFGAGPETCLKSWKAAKARVQQGAE